MAYVFVWIQLPSVTERALREHTTSQFTPIECTLPLRKRPSEQQLVPRNVRQVGHGELVEYCNNVTM